MTGSSATVTADLTNAEWQTLRSSTVSAPSVSVIMPVFNRASIVKAAIDSVLSLNEGAAELVIVDDGSTDRTRDILGAIDNPRLTVLFLKTNGGANRARNIGASVARAPVLAFLDSDDSYLPGRLTRPLKVLSQSPGVGIVLSSFTTAKRNKSKVVALRDGTYDSQTFQRHLARYILPATTTGITVRRDLFHKVGGFDPTLKRIQDLDFLLRAAPHADGATVADVLWHKNWQEDGISSRPATYYDALLALLSRHPIYHSTELPTREYLLARHLLAQTKSLKLGQMWRDYQRARSQLSPPPASIPQLLQNYVTTRRLRRRSQQNLLKEA
jgi:glycosyltransferase involved in cell wall biosynthesis